MNKFMWWTLFILPSVMGLGHLDEAPFPNGTCSSGLIAVGLEFVNAEVFYAIDASLPQMCMECGSHEQFPCSEPLNQPCDATLNSNRNICQYDLSVSCESQFFNIRHGLCKSCGSRSFPDVCDVLPPCDTSDYVEHDTWSNQCNPCGDEWSLACAEGCKPPLTLNAYGLCQCPSGFRLDGNNQCVTCSGCAAVNALSSCTSTSSIVSIDDRYCCDETQYFIEHPKCSGRGQVYLPSQVTLKNCTSDRCHYSDGTYDYPNTEPMNCRYQTCECLPGYGGIDCEIECPSTKDSSGIPTTICSGHGTCGLSGCECEMGWVGLDCAYQCPTTGSYVCNVEKTLSYTNVNPSTQQYDTRYCTLDALNQTSCECGSNYAGSQCEKTCPTSGGIICSGHGTCDSSGCQCDDGWAGYRCDTQCVLNPAADNLACSGHGSCTINKCECDDGYVPNGGSVYACQQKCPVGLNNTICSGHGICMSHIFGDWPFPMTASCYCDTYYYGGACENVCPMDDDGNVCSGHGYCNSNTNHDCQCFVGYNGDDCSNQCPETMNGICNGAGTCVDNQCICEQTTGVNDKCVATTCNATHLAQVNHCHGHGTCRLTDSYSSAYSIDIYGNQAYPRQQIQAVEEIPYCQCDEVRSRTGDFAFYTTFLPAPYNSYLPLNTYQSNEFTVTVGHSDAYMIFKNETGNEVLQMAQTCKNCLGSMCTDPTTRRLALDTTVPNIEYDCPQDFYDEDCRPDFNKWPNMFTSVDNMRLWLKDAVKHGVEYFDAVKNQWGPPIRMQPCYTYMTFTQSSQQYFMPCGLNPRSYHYGWSYEPDRTSIKDLLFRINNNPSRASLPGMLLGDTCPPGYRPCSYYMPLDSRCTSNTICIPDEQLPAEFINIPVISFNTAGHNYIVTLQGDVADEISVSGTNNPGITVCKDKQYWVSHIGTGHTLVINGVTLQAGDSAIFSFNVDTSYICNAHSFMNNTITVSDCNDKSYVANPVSSITRINDDVMSEHANLNSRKFLYSDSPILPNVAFESTGQCTPEVERPELTNIFGQIETELQGVFNIKNIFYYESHHYNCEDAHDDCRCVADHSKRPFHRYSFYYNTSYTFVPCWDNGNPVYTMTTNERYKCELEGFHYEGDDDWSGTCYTDNSKNEEALIQMTGTWDCYSLPNFNGVNVKQGGCYTKSSPAFSDSSLPDIYTKSDCGGENIIPYRTNDTHYDEFNVGECEYACFRQSFPIFQNNCTAGSFFNCVECELCPPGQFQGEDGALHCELCPSGGFSDKPGAKFCEKCGENSGGWFQVDYQRIGQTSCSDAGLCDLKYKHPSSEFYNQTECSGHGYCFMGECVCDKVSGEHPLWLGDECQYKCPYEEAQWWGCGAGRCQLTPAAAAAKVIADQVRWDQPDWPTGQSWANLTDYSMFVDHLLLQGIDNANGAAICACDSGWEVDSLGRCGQRTGCDNETILRNGHNCVKCPEGTYRNSSTTCADCPDGTWTYETGATSVTQCESCAIGSYRRSSETCYKCESGKYGTTINTCASCPDGSISQMGATSCTQCPTGKKSFQYVCQVYDLTCYPGEEDNNGVCTPCPKGFYNPSENGVCLPCPNGTISTDERTSCSTCPVGKYTLNDACEYCPKFTYNDEPGQTQCKICAAGKFAYNNLRCEDCQKGKWSIEGFKADTWTHQTVYGEFTDPLFPVCCDLGVMPADKDSHTCHKFDGPSQMWRDQFVRRFGHDHMDIKFNNAEFYVYKNAHTNGVACGYHNQPPCIVDGKLACRPEPNTTNNYAEEEKYLFCKPNGCYTYFPRDEGVVHIPSYHGPFEPVVDIDGLCKRAGAAGQPPLNGECGYGLTELDGICVTCNATICQTKCDDVRAYNFDASSEGTRDCIYSVSPNMTYVFFQDDTKIKFQVQRQDTHLNFPSNDWENLESCAAQCMSFDSDILIWTCIQQTCTSEQTKCQQDNYVCADRRNCESCTQSLAGHRVCQQTPPQCVTKLDLDIWANGQKYEREILFLPQLVVDAPTSPTTFYFQPRNVYVDTNNISVHVIPPIYNPCLDKTEGQICTLCDPMDSTCIETTVVKSCQNGDCIPTQAPDINITTPDVNSTQAPNTTTPAPAPTAPAPTAPAPTAPAPAPNTTTPAPTAPAPDTTEPAPAPEVIIAEESSTNMTFIFLVGAYGIVFIIIIGAMISHTSPSLRQGKSQDVEYNRLPNNIDF